MSPESPFLTELFKCLARENVAYCVLRNYETLPDSLNGSDVDILFSPESFDRGNTLLQQVASDFGGQCICELKAHRFRTMCFCGFHQEQWWGARFDTFSYVGTNGCTILPVDHILGRSLLYNGIRVANPADGFVVALIKEAIGAGRSRKDYAEKAAAAFSAEEALFSPLLQDAFGGEVFEKFLHPMLTRRNVDLRLAGRALRASSLRKRFLREPAGTAAVLARNVISKLCRFMRRPGFTLAVLGTDGAGKSSIIEGICPPLESALHSKAHCEHLRPNLLPSIAQLFGRAAPEGVVSDPHASKPSGTWGSIARLAYYSLDYVLGYWAKVFLRTLRAPCLFIFDRYFYDLLFDPHRSRIALPSWVVSLFGSVIPAPDLTLCLGADAEAIHARKPELPLEEVRRQLKALRQFSGESARAVWIDTGTSVEKSVHEALRAITAHMSKRSS